MLGRTGLLQESAPQTPIAYTGTVKYPSWLTYRTVSGTFFALVAALHAARLVFAWEGKIGNWTIPLWTSWLGLAVASGLSFWAFRVSRKF